MSCGARTTLALLIAAVLLFPLAPTDEAHAKSFEPEGIGLVDPATGEWHLRGPDGFATSFFYGNPGDFPIMGDWNCDTIDTPGLYRQSDGYVYLRDSNTQGNADIRFYFGNPGDIPLAGDFDGDGCDTVSIYREAEGRVYIINELGANEGGLGAADYDYYFGNPGDKPFVGDFNGDGTDTIGLHRESTGLVYFRYTNTQGIADESFIFGDPGDRMIAGDWTDDGTDTVGLFRPSTFAFYLRYTNTQGNANDQFEYGIPRMLPVSGKFGILATDVSDRSWTVSTVTAPVEWGMFASLGFGADGRAVVSHGTRTGWNVHELAITQCSNQACTASATRIEPWRVADHTSMATGADWLPVWSFHDESGGRLVVGRCTDAQCSSPSFSVVDPADLNLPSGPTNVGAQASTAIGANGNPIIVYAASPAVIQDIRLALCADRGCSAANRVLLTTRAVRTWLDVAIGADDLPISAMFGFDGQRGSDLTTVHCADSECSTGAESTIQSWRAGFESSYFPSIAIGTDGLPIVAYNEDDVFYDSNGEPVRSQWLRVAKCLDIACESHTPVKVVEGRATFVSMDIGGDGLPFIAYRMAGSLKVAHCNDVACTSSTIATVDPGLDVGAYASLATDPFGMPMIAYYDAAGHDLKIARLGP